MRVTPKKTGRPAATEPPRQMRLVAVKLDAETDAALVELIERAKSNARFIVRGATGGLQSAVIRQAIIDAAKAVREP